MFGVAEVTRTTTSTATTRILNILTLSSPPIHGMYGVEENTATATITTANATATAATKTTPSLFLRHVGYFPRQNF